MRINLGLRQLEALVEIASSGSFSSAAENLHVSQPALSRTVRLAEEALGARLFDRGARNVTLTAAGAELLPIARRIVLEFSDSLGELAQFMEGRRGRVRISGLPSTAQPMLVQAVTSFSDRFPDIEFLLRLDDAEVILRMLEACEIDIGLTVQPPPDGRFSYQHLYDDEFVLICRAGSPLDRETSPARPLGWQVFEKEKFVAATPGSNTRGVTDAAFMRAGVTVRPAHEVAGNLKLIGSMVAAGLGVSVLPASAFEWLDLPDLAARRLTKPKVKRKVGIVTLAGRTLSTATLDFVAHMRQLSAARTAAPPG